MNTRWVIRRKGGVLLLKFVSVFLFLPLAPKKSLRHVSCVPSSNIKALLECTEVAALPVLQYFQQHANQEVTTSSPSHLDWPHGRKCILQTKAVSLAFPHWSLQWGCSAVFEFVYSYAEFVFKIVRRPYSLYGRP